MIGRLVSFWDGLFSGAMLVLGSVTKAWVGVLYWKIDLTKETLTSCDKLMCSWFLRILNHQPSPPTSSSVKIEIEKLLYFEWSPPWHVGWRLSGEGRHWEYDGKNGEFENIDFRFPWLSDTSEMGFGHDVPFLNYSDRLPHPSDLCQPDRVRWG